MTTWATKPTPTTTCRTSLASKQHDQCYHLVVSISSLMQRLPRVTSKSWRISIMAIYKCVNLATTWIISLLGKGDISHGTQEAWNDQKAFFVFRGNLQPLFFLNIVSYSQIINSYLKSWKKKNLESSVHVDSGAKEKLQNVPWFEMDFVLNFAMCLADFTCVNRSTIQIVFSELL